MGIGGSHPARPRRYIASLLSLSLRVQGLLFLGKERSLRTLFGVAFLVGEAESFSNLLQSDRKRGHALDNSISRENSNIKEEMSFCIVLFQSNLKGSVEKLAFLLL